MKTLLMLALVTAGITQPAATVFIADDGSTYHRRDCPTIQGISKIVGYRRDRLPPKTEPCSVCRPDDHALEPTPESTEPHIVIGPRSTGASLLTRDTYDEAIRCGDSALPLNCLGVARACDFASMYVGVHTPFTSVALGVLLDKQQLRPLTPPTMASANSKGVVFTVTPGDNFRLANSVTNLVIERQGTRVLPTWKSVEPQVFQNGFRVSRSLNRGTFGFPISAVSPNSDIDLLIAVERDFPLRCTIPAATLGQLR